MRVFPSRLHRRRVSAWARLFARALAAAGLLFAAGLAAVGKPGLLCLAFLTAAPWWVLPHCARARACAKRARPSGFTAQ